MASTTVETAAATAAAVTAATAGKRTTNNDIWNNTTCSNPPLLPQSCGAPSFVICLVAVGGCRGFWVLFCPTFLSVWDFQQLRFGVFGEGVFPEKCLHWRGSFWKKFLWDLQEKITSEHRKTHKRKLCAEVSWNGPFLKTPFSAVGKNFVRFSLHDLHRSWPAPSEISESSLSAAHVGCSGRGWPRHSSYLCGWFLPHRPARKRPPPCRRRNMWWRPPGPETDVKAPHPPQGCPSLLPFPASLPLPFFGGYATSMQHALALKTLTYLNREPRPFFLGDNSIWSFRSVLPLVTTALRGPEGDFSLAIKAFGAFERIVPNYRGGAMITV